MSSLVKSILEDGYIPSTILAKELGLKQQNVFRDTKLKKIKFKNVLLVKIPKEALRYVTGGYTATLLLDGEPKKRFDYILEISKTRKVGFWK